MLAFRQLGFFILGLSSLLFLQCSKPQYLDEFTEVQEKDSIAARYLSVESINFGLPPWGAPAEIEKSYGPFLKYLSAKLGTSLRLYISADYSMLLTDLKENRVQFALLPAGLYADSLNQKMNLRYIASTVQGNKNHYRGLIIVRKNFPGETLADLKEKKFAFVEKSSSSGYKYPLAAMIKSGIHPDKHFGQIFFWVPTRSNAVLRGSIDGGAVYDDLLENDESENELKILFKTETIPFEAMVSAPATPGRFTSKLRYLLTEISEETRLPDGTKVLDSSKGIYFSGFTVKSEDFYSFTREIDSLVRQYSGDTP